VKSDTVLKIDNLHFSFDTFAGEVQAVRGVSFHVNAGETLGIVGESGCGKSVTAKSITKLNPMPPGRVKSGSIHFGGVDITNYSSRKMRPLRAKEMRMIFQDPMTSLNPTMQVGKQIVEGIMKNDSYMKKADAKRSTVEMLKVVGLPNPEMQYKKYPHELSGGMRQRAMIALAMAVNPKLLIADEPTTALDVTIQAQILRLMKKIQKLFKTSIILITHDLGVISTIADRVVVMYSGIIVETASVYDIFDNPQHPYTWGLLDSIPKLHTKSKEELIPIKGTPPDLIQPPEGCPFAPRCTHAMKICNTLMPEEVQIGKASIHKVSCWLQHPQAAKVKKQIFLERGSISE
jgi:oligopeptide transport system ATP-binding protein